MSSNTTPLPDATIRFDNLPSAGRSIEVGATREEREVIAERLNVTSVELLQAKLHASPIKGGIQVQGRVEAKVTQPCVITFVPVVQSISETFARVFLHGREEEYTGPPGAEVFIDLEGEDLPDYFEGPEVDFSDLILEAVALAIDPYPKAPGAEVPEAFSEEDEDTSPFASLKQLKSPRD